MIDPDNFLIGFGILTSPFLLNEARKWLRDRDYASLSHFAGWSMVPSVMAATIVAIMTVAS